MAATPDDLSPGLLNSPLAMDLERLDERLAKEAASADPVSQGSGPRNPWAHRSAVMRCTSCIWFAAKTQALGRCRRRSPTMNGYPVVFPHDWCGDHKLNEEAV